MRMMHKLSLRFGVDTSINQRNITTIPYHFILTILKVNFDLNVSVANDVAFDVAKCTLPGKVMQYLNTKVDKIVL